MTCCGHCRDSEKFFSLRTARKELRRYRRKGPVASTHLLLEALRAQGVDGRTLLDVGGGVGVVQHELFLDGLRSAFHVDASTAYLEISRDEADRVGHGDRITYVHGDFVEAAPDLPMADIVTLDRVICCYPDLEPLLQASLAKARHVYGLVYPRELWGIRAALALGNLYFRLRRSAFRVYLHPARKVDAFVREHGFRRARSSRTLLWRVVTYVREA
jgi:2-polyprenyl-3-methyl-5-hydroxy-6-metoxy-1,4-benzoquinol methylase